MGRDRRQNVSFLWADFRPLWLVVVATLLLAAATGVHRLTANDGGDQSAANGNNPPANTGDQQDNPDSDRSGPAKSEPASESPFPQRLKVPEGFLDSGHEWLNVAGPISMRDLKGKIVVIDFWTYCCINCMHVLPELKHIEHKFPNEVVVIGCHSAKFDNEKETENIRRAVMRYEIEHPVINDAEMTVWSRFQVRAWPTVAFIDPEGYFLGSLPGEVSRDTLSEIIGKLIKYHKAKGTLDETPVRFELESAKLKPTPLRFPSKLLADESSNRLFIADSNHNRIVVSSLDGELLDVIGSGTAGSADGRFEDAQFDHPHGMALAGETLYVSDTENHLIRTVNLAERTVATLAGTGKQARRRVSSGKLRETALNSPWALVVVDDVLYIAMAGPHQIWRHQLGSNEISSHAGSGREDIIDGALSDAALAQPSGIVTDGEFLYITDSEGSSIRRIATDPNGQVTTVVGTAHLPNARLFTFGDVDGQGADVRFQHPIGIAITDKSLYVADSYNHKIRKVALGDNEGETSTFLGDGTRGDRLEPVRLSEPEGLAVASGKLYIADTNNHRIVVADLDTRNASRFDITGLKPPKAPKTKAPAGKRPRNFVDVPLQTVAAGEALNIDVALTLPEGYKLNKLAPLRYRLGPGDDKQDLIAAEQFQGRHPAQAQENSVTLTIPLSRQSGKATFELSVSYGYCRDGKGGLCKIATSHWRIPVEVTQASKQQRISLEAEPAK